MAEIQTSTWSETAGSNTAAAPDGWPEGMTYAAVNNAAREMMAALKREWNRTHPTVTSGGAADVQTLTYSNAPPAYVTGMQFTFIAGFTNTTTTPTLNVNALGAKTIVRADGSTAIVAGEVVANNVTTVWYDGTNFRLASVPATATGVSLIRAADAAAVRTAAGAPAVPISGSGVGQITTLSGATGAAVALPAGGTWAYVLFPVTGADRTWGTHLATVQSDVAAGGATVGAATVGVAWFGFCWRIT